MSIRFLRMIFAAGVMILGASGCASLGPRTIGPDRIDYIQEISESWKKQMLLNIVKLRYFDPPTFLDVSSIINQYGMENQVNTDARWYWPIPSASYGANAGVGGYSRYSDKPTITYTPLSGQKFTKNLLTPIPPVAVVSLIQSGWPIDLIFSLVVKTINGVNNNSARIGSDKGKEDFQRLLQALRTVQLAGVTDFRLAKVDDKEAVVFVISDEAYKEEYQKETQTIRNILKIKPDVNQYKIVFGSLPKSDDEVALSTRSMIEIMVEMSAVMDVPPEHVKDKWVKETVRISDSEGALAHIRSGRDKPQNAFAAVRYNNTWFWVDNSDINSKRNFALLMFFMSLTETEEKASAPLLTI